MFDAAPKEVFRHYKELEQVGLAAPQVTYIMHRLNERGMDVDTDATTVEEAKEAIVSAWKKKHDSAGNRCENV